MVMTTKTLSNTCLLRSVDIFSSVLFDNKLNRVKNKFFNFFLYRYCNRPWL